MALYPEFRPVWADDELMRDFQKREKFIDGFFKKETFDKLGLVDGESKSELIYTMAFDMVKHMTLATDPLSYYRVFYFMRYFQDNLVLFEHV